MIKKCLCCKEEMVEAWLNTGVGAFLIEEKKNDFKSKTSSVSAHVCPNCGHVELVADNMEIFKR